jgi:hypothetical protein
MGFVGIVKQTKVLKRDFLNPVKIGEPPKTLSPVQLIAKYKSKMADQIEKERQAAE